MKSIRPLLLSYLLLMCCTLFAQNNNPFDFINPKPASIIVSNETNIILRYSSTIDQSTLANKFIRVVGSISGNHAGELILADDNRTLVFNPFTTFVGSEDVNVKIFKGIKTKTGNIVPEFSFNFTTAPIGIVQLPIRATSIADNQSPIAFNTNENNSSLPAPPITINSVNNPSDGYIFMATWDRNVPAKYGNFIFILDKNGAIVDSIRVDGAPYDFRVQPNGLLTYALGNFSSNIPLPGEELQHIVLDSTLTVVDSFKMKNGYTADFHEFRMLPNGHVIMMSYHSIIYDMSKIVEGGKTDAELVINIIQEQDKDKNVVFEWRNIDYIPITDTDLNLTDSRINYGTLNAFDVDVDGNILASFRNHSEIMKISRTTGEVLWRMGGPRSEFSFVGEHEENAPYYHSRQHNIQRNPNGNITMFDNGEVHMPPYSRAVEYSLDEVNKVATLVSEWKYPNGNIFCVTAGNAELLTDGGWFIGYGVPNPQFVKRNAVEVHPDGSIALELSLPSGVLAYRVTKFPWKGSVRKPTFTNFEVKEGNTYSYNNETIITGIDIKYTSLSAADYNESKITRLPYGPVQPEFIENIITVSPVSIIYEGFAINSQTAEFSIDLSKFPEIKNPATTIIYYREFQNHGLFIPKSTTFNANDNKLVASLTGFGEIVFGNTTNDLNNNIPILCAPLNEQKLILQDTITIQWTGKGFYDSFNVQISTDSTFSTILDESSTNLSYHYISGLTNNTKYFWRVNSELAEQTSQWSDIWSFTITDPFINNVVPEGGETWGTGKTEIIRWQTNLPNMVRIDLLKEQNIVFAIDTILGSYLAYEWKLPENIQSGENYKIQITSESDATVFGISGNVFTISDSITSVIDEENHTASEYSLAQNYPNPFNPVTTISYSVARNSFTNGSQIVQLKVFNIMGEEVKTLVNTTQAPGEYQIQFDAGNLPSGIYFYRLTVGRFNRTNKMLLLK